MSVLIPVFNEEREVAGILAAVRGWLKTNAGDWEIVVVDNASTDATCAVAASLADGERVRVLRNERNRGKGYSIRRGMLEARGELRLMCDADCAPSLVSLRGMVEAARHADVVAGSRVAQGAAVGRYQPLHRRAVSLGFIGLCRLIMGEPAKDIFCGFKLWRAEAAEAVFSRAEIDGWSFDVEAFALARALGYRVVEHGIVWSHRPESRLSIRATAIPALSELVRARRRVRARVAEARADDALVPEHEPV